MAKQEVGRFGEIQQLLRKAYPGATVRDEPNGLLGSRISVSSGPKGRETVFHFTWANPECRQQHIRRVVQSDDAQPQLLTAKGRDLGIQIVQCMEKGGLSKQVYLLLPMPGRHEHLRLDTGSSVGATIARSLVRAPDETSSGVDARAQIEETLRELYRGENNPNP